MEKEKKEILKFGLIFSGVWALLCLRSLHHHGWTAETFIALAVSAAMFGLTAFYRPGVAAVKRILGRAVEPLGKILTAILMLIVFYLIFTPIAVILKIAGQDLLDERIDEKKNSYWRAREPQPFLKEKYLQQF
jgi:hypothetical protein